MEPHGVTAVVRLHRKWRHLAVALLFCISAPAWPWRDLATISGGHPRVHTRGFSAYALSELRRIHRSKQCVGGLREGG
jgi:hypothetical protein